MEDSLIADGCHIEGHVKNCVLFRDVVVEKGAEASSAEQAAIIAYLQKALPPKGDLAP